MNVPLKLARSGWRSGFCTASGYWAIFNSPVQVLRAMARGRGLPLPTVFTLHSAFAGVCGALALLVPAFFCQVFPDLASHDLYRYTSVDQVRVPRARTQPLGLGYRVGLKPNPSGRVWVWG